MDDAAHTAKHIVNMWILSEFAKILVFLFNNEQKYITVRSNFQSLIGTSKTQWLCLGSL